MDRDGGAFFFLYFLLTPYTAENDVHLVSCFSLISTEHFITFPVFRLDIPNRLMLVFLQVGSQTAKVHSSWGR